MTVLVGFRTYRQYRFMSIHISKIKMCFAYLRNVAHLLGI